MNAHRPHEAAQRGMTLIEATISTTIVGVMMVAALSAVGAAQRSNDSDESFRFGSALTEDLMNEILGQAYTGADDAGAAGPSAVESGTGDRSLFDDVNDYINWSESPPLRRDGTPIPGLEDWKRTVAIRFLNKDDRSQSSATDQGVAMIAVSAIRGGATVSQLVTIRTGGLPATVACCGADRVCREMTLVDCVASGGRPRWAGSTCALEGCTLDPVAWWKLDEGSGSTASDAMGMHAGTLYNGPTWISGKYDRALSFDGTNDYVQAAHHPRLSIQGQLTITAWIYKSSNVGSDALLSKGSSTTDYNYCVGTIGSNLVFTADTGNIYSSSFSISTGRWIHIAVVYKDSSNVVEMYVDGTLSTTRTCNDALRPNTQPLYLGRTGIGSYWAGRLDDVRVYDRALTAAEIGDVMNGK